MQMDRKIRFHSDGKFRILMVLDLHERPVNGRELLTHRIVEGLEALLTRTSPDMVLVGGDQFLTRMTSAALSGTWSIYSLQCIKEGCRGVLFSVIMTARRDTD